MPLGGYGVDHSRLSYGYFFNKALADEKIRVLFQNAAVYVSFAPGIRQFQRASMSQH